MKPGIYFLVGDSDPPEYVNTAYGALSDAAGISLGGGRRYRGSQTNRVEGAVRKPASHTSHISTWRSDPEFGVVGMATSPRSRLVIP